MRRCGVIGLAVILLLTTGCASALIRSGETLDAIGRQFVTVGNHWNMLLESKQITPAQYEEWAVFARDFQRAYPLAVDVWKAARMTGDKAAEDRMGEAITLLATKLTPLAIKAYDYAAPAWRK